MKERFKRQSFLEPHSGGDQCHLGKAVATQQSQAHAASVRFRMLIDSYGMISLARLWKKGLRMLREPYSVLNALIGEIDAARPAGMIAAKNAHAASAPAATLSAIGSQNETP